MSYSQRNLTMTDPDMGAWSYAYDALGNLTRQTDAKNQRICFYYDALNRLTSASASGGLNGVGDYAIESYAYNVKRGTRSPQNRG